MIDELLCNVTSTGVLTRDVIFILMSRNLVSLSHSVVISPSFFLYRVSGPFIKS